MPASPSSLSVVTDVVQAVDEPGAELSAAGSGAAERVAQLLGRPVSLTITGFPVRIPADPPLPVRDRPDSEGWRLRRSVPALGSGSGT